MKLRVAKFCSGSKDRLFRICVCMSRVVFSGLALCEKYSLLRIEGQAVQDLQVVWRELSVSSIFYGFFLMACVRWGAQSKVHVVSALSDWEVAI